MSSANRKTNRFAEKVAEENRRIAEQEQRAAILGPNGQPSKLNFNTIAAQGSMATPAMFPPLPMGNGQFGMPVVGGATRLEEVAKTLAAGKLAYCGCCDMDQVVQESIDLIQRCNARAGEVMLLPPTAQPENGINGDTGEAPAGDGPGENPQSPIVGV